MSASARQLQQPVDVRERLTNWLALLALCALGIVWPHEDTDAAAGLARRPSAQHCARAGGCQPGAEDVLLVAREGSTPLTR